MICPSCGSENPDSVDTCFKCGRSHFALTLGSLLVDRYEITAVIGKGGMGMVYAARDTVLEETVALKVLRPDLANAPDLEQRLRSEIKLARRVRHRNVCGIHEYGQTGHISFIVMELIDGVLLRQVLRERGPLPSAEAFDIALQLIDGLGAIHEAGVVHRDLKTSNIMLDRAGVVRLMDFGIAKDSGAEGAGLTATGQILGTPEYMSPEQAQGRPLDGRSDIYALGIVIFELFTGRVPFQGETPIAVIFKHLNDPPPFDDAGHRLPPTLETVLRRALDKDPERRFADTVEFAAAVTAARDAALVEASDAAAQTVTVALPTPPAGRGTSAPEPGGARRPHPGPAAVPASERPSRAGTGPGRTRAAAIGAAALVAAGLAAAWLSGAGARREPAEPPAPVTVATPDGGPVGGSPRPSVTAPPASDTGPTTTLPAPASPPADARPRAGRSPTPAPAVEKTGTSAAPVTGRVKLLILPWAEVVVDGRTVGTTPLAPLELSAGDHEIVLRHPKYKPLHKRVTVRAGATTELEVDLTFEAFPR